MRKPRDNQPNRVYHIISRIAHRAFFLNDEERDRFVDLLRRAADFSGVDLLSWCVMTNHVHVLVFVGERREIPDEEILRRMKVLYRPARFDELRREWDRLAAHPKSASFRRFRESFLKRMWNASAFMQTLKQHFTMSFNERREHTGTMWEGRCHMRVHRPDAVRCAVAEADGVLEGFTLRKGYAHWLLNEAGTETQRVDDNYAGGFLGLSPRARLVNCTVRNTSRASTAGFEQVYLTDEGLQGVRNSVFACKIRNIGTAEGFSPPNVGNIVCTGIAGTAPTASNAAKFKLLPIELTGMCWSLIGRSRPRGVPRSMSSRERARLSSMWTVSACCPKGRGIPSPERRAYIACRSPIRGWTRRLSRPSPRRRSACRSSFDRERHKGKALGDARGTAHLGDQAECSKKNFSLEFILFASGKATVFDILAFVRIRPSRMGLSPVRGGGRNTRQRRERRELLR